MKDSNFLKEMNARKLWHPMAHPGAMQDAPPKIITRADGIHITDIDGHRVLDAVGGPQSSRHWQRALTRPR